MQIRSARLPFARRLDAPFPLRLWHVASLDAPTVAVVWTLAFASAAGVSLPPWIPILLGLATWAVYIADRLLDARSALRSAQHSRLRSRHLFHWRHRCVLVPIAIAAGVSAASIVLYFMPVAARERSSVLALATIVYFSGVHSRRNLPGLPRPFQFPMHALGRVPLFSYWNELLVAIIFTSCCMLPVWPRATIHLGSLALAGGFFVSLTWLNYHSICRWEADGPRAHVTLAAGLLSITGFLLAVALWHNTPRPAALLVAGAASAAMLAFLNHYRARLTPLAVRATADLVLLTPIVLLLPPPHL